MNLFIFDENARIWPTISLDVTYKLIIVNFTKTDSKRPVNNIGTRAVKLEPEAVWWECRTALTLARCYIKVIYTSRDLNISKCFRIIEDKFSFFLVARWALPRTTSTTRTWLTLLSAFVSFLSVFFVHSFIFFLSTFVLLIFLFLLFVN